MSIIRKILKYLPGILIILLFLFVILTFRSYQILLLNNSVQTIPFGAIFFLILISITGVIFYFLLINAFGKYKSIENEIKSLKRFIEQSKKQEEEKKEEVVIIARDIEKEASALIPNSQDNIIKFGEVLLSNIAHKFEIVQGLIYLKNTSTGIYSFSSGYAFFSETEPVTYKEGETLSGQVAKNKQVMNLFPVPDDYVTILSGTGKGSPNHMLIIPIILNNDTVGIMEIASFKPFNEEDTQVFGLLGKKVGKLFTEPNNNKV